MSAPDDPRDASHPRDFGVLRSPGSGVGRPEDERESISTTQTNSGLAAGDPAGGPQRTPERRALDEARGHQPEVKGGHDPDLRPRDEDQVHAPEDVHATPPHGDKLGEGRKEGG
jgi:hypothetical protein